MIMIIIIIYRRRRAAPAPPLLPPALAAAPAQYVNTRSEKFASSQSPAIISLSSGVQ